MVEAADSADDDDVAAAVISVIARKRKRRRPKSVWVGAVMDNGKVKWGSIISVVHSDAAMFTIANQSQRTVCRLLANKNRTSSQTANIVGQHF